MASSVQNTSFITKYKPYYVREINADKRLTSILNTLLEIDDLNILFIGNASSGKTTLLYALLREYYGLDKNDAIPETNIMIINNLEEQGVNFFRNETKTFCQSHCSIYGKKKIIMIDDIDTINEQSQQVFRNYLDKYKNNVHFISACTNVQKVIESLQSRLHIINLSSPNMMQIESIMEDIIQKEGMNLEPSAKQYLLSKSGGSIRNIINHLEKIFIYSKTERGCSPMSFELCEQLCSTIYTHQFEEYIGALRGRRLKEAIQILHEIHDKGYSVIDILDYFYSFVKSTKILDEEQKYRIIPFLCKYIMIFNNIHEHSIELSLFTNNLYISVFSV
jgi:DNA polymerase III delta prime subunit